MDEREAKMDPWGIEPQIFRSFANDAETLTVWELDLWLDILQTKVNSKQSSTNVRLAILGNVNENRFLGLSTLR